MFKLHMDYYNSPDVYEFRLLGHDWELVVFDTSFNFPGPDDGLRSDAWLRMKDYGYMQHVMGVTAEWDYQNFIECLEKSIKQDCQDYLLVLDKNGWW